jgi:hypothetical protein
MPPPPSFRKSSISTFKPAVPVKGWWASAAASTDSLHHTINNNDYIMDEGSTSEHGHWHSETANELLKRYKGPCAFIIPGELSIRCCAPAFPLH